MSGRFYNRTASAGFGSSRVIEGDKWYLLRGIETFAYKCDMRA